MLQISLRALLLVATFGVTAPMAAAEQLAHLRVMLHPMVDPIAALAGLEVDAGMTLTITGKTRTGALEISLSSPVDAAASHTLLRKLRNDRNVLWVEPGSAVTNRQSIQKSMISDACFS